MRFRSLSKTFIKHFWLGNFAFILQDVLYSCKECTSCSSIYLCEYLFKRTPDLEEEYVEKVQELAMDIPADVQHLLHTQLHLLQANSSWS